MLKLYKLTGENKKYWETWENDGTYMVHWGDLGTHGSTKEVKGGVFTKPEKIIQGEINKYIAEGFAQLDVEDHKIVLVEFSVDGMGSEADLEKRYRLQDRMDETLGWTGLGNCDGGSIGSGTMEVCLFVVDFEIAKQVIIDDLNDTEFSDYTRIFLE